MSGKGTNESGQAREIPRNFIRAWRRYRGMTLEELAERAGLSTATISNAEKRKKDVTGKTLLEIARALDVSPGALLDTEPGQADDEIWRIWEDLGRLKRRDKATEVLRVLRDISRE